MTKLISLTIGLALSASISAFAAVSPEQATVLGKSLTHIGAENSGNEDGSIPEWNGGLPIDAGIITNGFRQNPYADEKPIFVIDGKNHTPKRSIEPANELSVPLTSGLKRLTTR